MITRQEDGGGGGEGWLGVGYVYELGGWQARSFHSQPGERKYLPSVITSSTQAPPGLHLSEWHLTTPDHSHVKSKFALCTVPLPGLISVLRLRVWSGIVNI